MPYYHPMMHPFIGIGIGLFWLIILIGVAYLIYRLIKSEKILVPSRPIIRTAEDILAERYAKGELTREQYMQIKKDRKELRELRVHGEQYEKNLVLICTIILLALSLNCAT